MRALGPKCSPSPSSRSSRAAAVSSKGAQSDEINLSSRIKSLTSYQDLVNLFDSQTNDSINHIHTSSLLSGLAKTFPRVSRMRGQLSKDKRRSNAVDGHAEAQAAFIRVLRHAAKPSVVSQMGPRELATSIWAAAKVLGGESAQQAPSSSTNASSWLEPLLNQALRVIPRFNPQDISMCLWSLATLAQASIQLGKGGGVDPNLSSRVIESLVQSSWDNMTHFGAQSISNTLWALSKLGKKPSDGWMRASEDRLVSLMHELTPQALANTSWAFVLLEHSPSDAWKSSFLLNTQMALFNPPSPTSNLIGPSAVIAWSIARLGLNVNNSWMDMLSNSVVTSLSASSSSLATHPNLPLDLANILWAMASLGYRPRAHVVSMMLSQCVLQLESMGPNELCSLLWSLAKIKYVPSGGEWRKMSDAIASACPSCSAQGLCNILWSVAALRLNPAPHWVKEILSTLRLKMDDCGPQELANLW